MSLRGQRFELDLDADDFTPKPFISSPSLIGEIKERTTISAPTAPSPKHSVTGFPPHKKRSTRSAFKEQRSSANPVGRSDSTATTSPLPPPSDRAIAHHVGQKYGYDVNAQEKIDISQENKQKIAQMSTEDIEQARAELMSTLNPSFIQQLLNRANLDPDPDIEQPQPQTHTSPSLPSNQTQQPLQYSPSLSDQTQQALQSLPSPSDQTQQPLQSSQQPLQSLQQPLQSSPVLDHTTDAKSPRPDRQLSPPPPPSVHFPQPPINPSTFKPLDPTSPAFLQDLKTHYFPTTPHDPSTLTWLTDPTPTEQAESAYNPDRPNYQISQLRFSFTGTLIPPAESQSIPTSAGLHHHGLAPTSAGYTIPELAILSRSAMPAQRCIAYQILGRLMYRLGRGAYGVAGGELYDGLWHVVEREKVVSVLMAEANRTHRATGHHRDHHRDHDGMSRNDREGRSSTPNPNPNSNSNTTDDDDAAAAAAADGAAAVSTTTTTSTTGRGHATAIAYAVEALWLWRRGCGGERGLLKENGMRAK